jgi:hypothetical protein
LTLCNSHNCSNGTLVKSLFFKVLIFHRLRKKNAYRPFPKYKNNKNLFFFNEQ